MRLSWLSFALLPALVSARAILGVDLGSLYMKVALVQSGSPLEIVTNLHSKRKTEQMVLFDNEQRFYGADASSLLARKSHLTPAAMSVLLGRDEQHPMVRVLAERHYPIQPSFNETRSGVVLTVDGQQFTPEELVAMVLQHAVDISVAHSAAQGSNIAPPTDCMLTVPMYATQQERRALLDAAKLADLNVLGLIDENTAAALHYAMDKNFPEEQLFLFYNMGASAVKVSLVRFFEYEQPQKFGKPKNVPAVEILAKAWDQTLGGESFDHAIVEYLADQFNQQWQKAKHHQKDIRDVPRAMTKLRLQASKVKHVLSANTEFPVYMDAVHDDISLQTLMTRDLLETLCHDLWQRAVAPIHAVLHTANKTLEDLTGTELIGGGMRMPRVQTELLTALNAKVELGMHINADESMALGAAFAGANVSTAFRVRHVGLTDVNPFGMSITLEDLVSGKNEEDAWSKHATIFKSFGKMGVKKTIAFTHDKDVHCSLDYEESDLLPAGTERALERYNITGVSDFAKEMEGKGLGKPKVSLQFELSQSGITALVKAEVSVEETYKVEEEVEVDDEDNNDTSTEDKKGETTSDNTNETTKEEKKKKTVMVEKEKKKLHKKALSVSAYHVGRVKPYSAELLASSKAKLLAMAERDKERMMLEEARNRVEAYMYKIKNKLVDDEEEINNVSTREEREACRRAAEKAEEWLFAEGFSADLKTMEAKYKELSEPFEKILFRISESTARPEAIKTLQKKLTEVEELLQKWETSRPQVTAEERGDVLKKVESVRSWIAEKEAAQAQKKPHEEPAFTSEEVALQLKPVEALVVRLSRKPKPKPEKKEKAKDNATTTDEKKNDTEGSNETVSSEEANETLKKNNEEGQENTGPDEKEDEL